MNRSFLLKLTITISFIAINQLNATHIVFLRGWFGAQGKVEICNELQYNNPNWKVIDEDELFYLAEPLHWRELFPQEFLAIREVIDAPNILNAVKRNQILYKKDVSLEARQKALNAMIKIREAMSSMDESTIEMRRKWNEGMRQQIIMRISAWANAGYNVVVNTWFLEPKDYDRFRAEHRVHVGMIYCPFDEVVRRIITKNHESIIKGELSATRFLDQGLMHFKALHDFKSQNTIVDQNAIIDTLSLNTFNNACDLIELTLTESSHAAGASKKFIRGEMSRQQFNEYKKTVLEVFGESNPINIVAKSHFDFLLNTAQLSPRECAQRIMSRLDSI